MEEKRSQLEKRLSYIKELKSERYIGTKDAFRYVKAIGRLYDNPKLVADKINSELRNAFKETRYPATPAKILGFTNAVSEAIALFNWFDFKPDEVTRIDNPIITCCEKIIGISEHPSVSKPNLELVAQYLLPKFSTMQRLSNPSNKMFAELLIKELDNNKNEKFIKYLNSKINWDEELSEENLRHTEKKIEKSIEALHFEDMQDYFKIKNDMVLGRFENRRQIITNLFLSRGFETYERGEEIIGRWLRDIAEEVGLGDADDFHYTQLEFYQFLLRTLYQEKNFLRRFLAS